MAWLTDELTREEYLAVCKDEGLIRDVPRYYQDDPYIAYIAGHIRDDVWADLCKEMGWPETGPEKNSNG
jgi:hypothetical protein